MPGAAGEGGKQIATTETRGRAPAPRRAPRSVRVNVTIAADELAEIDAYAARHGLTRSGFLAAAARRKLDESA